MYEMLCDSATERFYNHELDIQLKEREVRLEGGREGVEMGHRHTYLNRRSESIEGGLVLRSREKADTSCGWNKALFFLSLETHSLVFLSSCSTGWCRKLSLLV